MIVLIFLEVEEGMSRDDHVYFVDNSLQFADNKKLETFFYNHIKRFRLSS